MGKSLSLSDLQYADIYISIMSADDAELHPLQFSGASSHFSVAS